MHFLLRLSVAEAYLNTSSGASSLDGVDLALPVGMAMAAGCYAVSMRWSAALRPKEARRTTPRPD
ncbi:hypothetical protein ACFU6I_40310 [Streptomyces sp. NPDC057486]|uniref:hypothetical protein n=1 Tax=Streptomyces sp. NPDC057486 TaxID=3346145 RepID=UPI00367E36DC